MQIRTTDTDKQNPIANWYQQSIVFYSQILRVDFNGKVCEIKLAQREKCESFV